MLKEVTERKKDVQELIYNLVKKDREHDIEFLKRTKDLLQKTKPKSYITEESRLVIIYRSHDATFRTSVNRYLTRKLQLGDVLSEKEIEVLGSKITDKEFGCYIKLLKENEITAAFREEFGGHTCMTGSSHRYTRLYETNPEIYSLVTATCGSGKGRAILAKLDDGRYYLDRIYANQEHIKTTLLKYAVKKDWVYRLFTTADSYAAGFQNKPLEQEEYNNLTISNVKFRQGEVPYQDSFKRGLYNNGKLDLIHALSDRSEYSIGLCSTSGKISHKDLNCADCGCSIIARDSVSYQNGRVCSDCFSMFYKPCSKCGEIRNIHSLNEISGGERYCNTCVQQLNFPTCSNCRMLAKETKTVKLFGEVCIPCLERENYFFTCLKCNHIWPEPEFLPEKGYCLECAEKGDINE